MIFIGCCGFPVSKKKYFNEFSVVEVQQTFYQMPRMNTLRRWRDEASKNFEFIVKAWQGITHPITSPTWRRFRGILPGNKDNYGELRYTDEVLTAWGETVKAMDILNSNKVVIQLPPKLKWNRETKENVISTLTEFTKDDRYLIVEPRHISWWNKDVERIFRNLNIVHCVDPFKHQSFEVGDFHYYRLHGVNGYNYSYKYNKKDLEKLLKRVIKNMEKDCYIMFNNKYMYKDSLLFRKILLEKGYKSI